MKRILIVATLFAVGQARASFDLLLLADSTSHCIHRVDPISGAYLGNFGGNRLYTPTGIAANRSTGEAFISDSARGTVSVWNYNTGEYLREFQVYGSSLFTRPRDVTLTSRGTLLVSGDYDGVVEVDTDYGVTQWSEHNNTAGAVLGLDNHIYELGAQYSFQAFLRNIAPDGTIAGGATNYPFGLAHGIISRSGADGFIGTNGNGFCSFKMGPSPEFGQTINGPTAMPHAAQLAFGHGNTLWVSGTDASGGVEVMGYNYAAGLWDRSPLTFGPVQRIDAMTSILAPEPSSLVACGVGLYTLLVRRRHRRS